MALVARLTSVASFPRVCLAGGWGSLLCVGVPLVG